MLRVAILALSAKSYGGDAYFKALLPSMAKHAREVEFIVLTCNDCYRPLCPESGPVRLKRCIFPGIKFGLLRALWEQIALPNILDKLGVDVVYTANNVGILCSPRPCVISIRNMEPLVSLPRGVPAFLRVRHRLLKWLTKVSVERASRVVAVSGFVRDTLVAQGIPSEKIDVIYHGIDDLTPPPETSDQRGNQVRYVASAGKFIRYANLSTLFCAFARMRSLGYKGDLRFAGGSYDHRHEKELKRLVRKLGIEPYVHFLGYIPRAEVQEMIRDCDVFLFPSTLEACPFTLLEAMWQGSPIVTTTAKPMPEFCGDAVLYVDPINSEAFAEEAYRVASSPELQDELRQRARTRAQSFQWEDSVKQLITTLDKAACAS